MIEPGSAVYGMGTYACITPVFTARPPAAVMIARGLNTEHHAVPDRFVSFIYNHGGSLVKWFRDTFASAEHRQAQRRRARMSTRRCSPKCPRDPSRVIVLPHFATTGPPEFIADSCGVMVGLTARARRAAKSSRVSSRASNYYLKECVDALPATGITITDYRAVGGGSKSDVWIQTCADMMGRPFSRPVITEAGALGAAIMAGVGSGLFASYSEGVDAMVKLEQCFDPDPAQHQRYDERYALYQPLWPLMRDYLRQIDAANRAL